MSSLHTVMIPGLGCSARLYDGIAPYAWQHGGYSIPDTRRDVSLAGIAERLLAGAPQHFVLVGLSMGGYVAFEVLRRAPERVLGLGLISTSARPDSPEQSERRIQQLAIIRGGGFDKLLVTSVPSLVRPASAEDPGLTALVVQMGHEIGATAYLAQIEAVMRREDSRPTLARIACPTAVIHGEDDRLLPLEHGQEIAAGIAGAAMTIVRSCGHLSTLEQPAGVAAALEGLYARVGSK